MKILFVHQNFPGQFKHLAPALAQQGHDVHAMSMRDHKPMLWQGVKISTYTANRNASAHTHPWLGDFESKVIRGEAAFHHARALQAQGFTPDVIVAHHGWGESLFLKEVWPHAKLGLYCEYFYQASGLDVGFDPEFPSHNTATGPRLRLKNLNNLMHFDIADGGLSPTQWQASTFPDDFQRNITVVHDGIDTDSVAPQANATFSLGNGHTLTRDDEVITFINRNLEPYRGYHVFMRALPQLLKQRPKAQVLIVGGDGVSYGAPAPQGSTWKDIFLQEVKPQISDEDWARVHFLGKIKYEHFITLLQVSRLHIYLTYPFVLSWSLLEAMSAGATILASDTPPVREVITHNDNGVLVPFFDRDALVHQACRLLDDASERARLSQRARTWVVDRYDLKTRCLPQQVAWVTGWLNGRQNFNNKGPLEETSVKTGLPPLT